MTTSTRKLGVRQRKVLELLETHGDWNPAYPGWVWGSVSETATVLESLARRGLVERVGTDHARQLGVYRAKGLAAKVADGAITLTEAFRVLDAMLRPPAL